MALPSVSEDTPFRVLLLTADDAAGRQLFHLLEKTGFDVRRVTEAVMGLAMWEGFNPHLVVADSRPLGLDGLAICRRAREDESMIPILLLGVTDDTQEISALKAGADDYLDEPLSMPVILARVVAQLRRAYRYNPQPVAVSNQADETEELHPFWEDEDEEDPFAEPGTSAPVEEFNPFASVPFASTPFMTAPAAQGSDVLPPGWAECDLCGYRAKRQDFEKEDITGAIRLVCPNCKESEHVVYSLNL